MRLVFFVCFLMQFVNSIVLFLFITMSLSIYIKASLFNRFSVVLELKYVLGISNSLFYLESHKKYSDDFETEVSLCHAKS